VKPLAAVLAGQIALALALIALVATDNVPFVDGDSDAAPRAAAGPTVDRFDSRAAFRLLRGQVELGPRPAGSRASRRLAARLRRLLPNGTLHAIPGHPGLRNVVGRVRGGSRSYVVVGAHYDTKDIPGFVGANDGASGTATVVQLARELRGTRPAKTLVFILFDGEESPGPGDDGDFLRTGLRGSKAAVRRYAGAEAMVLLDFVGDRRLRIPREELSNRRLWSQLRAAARRVGAARVFPPSSADAVYDDHVPFRRRGIPAIDLIDFDFPCWHRRCDNMSAVSERSLDLVGETVYELLASL
jgi:glutaminyl-peptide cyclotransferase